MKRRVSGFAVGMLAAALSCGPAYAAIDEFEGRWKNVDPETRGLTTLEIKVRGDTVTVQAWGKCHPTDCDWGTVEATPYAPEVGSALPRNAQALTAGFQSGFSERIVIIDTAGGHTLRVEVLTRFTDKSGRSAYSAVYKFARAR